MAAGSLRIYLGAAPGVGKTYAMLDEGWRRRQRGADVVVGLVEAHQRPRTIEQLRDLEIVPRRAVEYRGTTLDELDVDAVIARHPQVALVDELAHTNAPGSRNEKRWQDIQELLDAGIDVISTVNIQHLESLNDVTARITGVTQRETVPDAFVRNADQIELVDMTPEALRRRMAHGNIYAADRIDAALGNYFRPGNLTALRELALLWVADRVEDNLQSYLAQHGIHDTWETRERVVVTVTGAPSSDALVRRAARMAGRTRGELIGVRVVHQDGRAAENDEAPVEEQRKLLEALGGTYHEVIGDDIASTLAAFARAEHATQLVVGASRPTTWQRLTGGAVTSRLLRQLGTVDIHVIGTQPRGGGTPPGLLKSPRRSVLPRRRRLGGWLVLLGAAPLMTVVLVALRDQLSLATVVELYLALVIVVAAVGGFLPGIVASLTGSLLVNWFFTPPLGTFTIAQPQNATSIIVFATIATVVSFLTDRVARRSQDAQRARTEAEALARTTAVLVTDDDPLPRLLEQLRTTMGVDAAAILGRDDRSWLVVAASGVPVPASPSDGEAFELQVEEGLGRHVLVLVGRALELESRRVLHALAAQLTVAIDARELERIAREAAVVSRADEVRAALLRSVSHDLRTPLATIKAYVSGLRQPDVTWSAADVDDALAAVEAECDRLNELVGNLLDASRLEAGAVAVSLRPTAVDEVLERIVTAVPDRHVHLVLPDDLPLVTTDPTLLERAVANLVANAIKHNGEASTPVRIDAQPLGDLVHLRIIDHGPGIEPDQRGHLFQPFQRLGDAASSDGVGLGLAIAHGFVTAVGGSLDLDDTPGGGVTATIRLPISERTEARG